jgi:hypothetical protein
MADKMVFSMMAFLWRSMSASRHERDADHSHRRFSLIHGYLRRFIFSRLGHLPSSYLSNATENTGKPVLVGRSYRHATGYERVAQSGASNHETYQNGCEVGHAFPEKVGYGGDSGGIRNRDDLPRQKDVVDGVGGNIADNDG